MKKTFRFILFFLSKKKLEAAPAAGLCLDRPQSPFPTRRRGDLDSRWFAGTFAFSLFFSISLLVFGKRFVMSDFGAAFSAHSVPPLKAPASLPAAALQQKAQQTAALSFPPFPVNLKSGAGSALALVKIDLKTDRPAAKKEILLKNKKFKRHLLLLLSGKERGDLTKNKAFFEERIRSQFNIFLSQGSVEEVRFQTTFIN